MSIHLLIIPLLILVPLVAGGASLMIRADYPRRVLLISTAAAHLILTIFSQTATPVLGNWLAIDSLGRLFLGIASILFLTASVYGVGYLAREKIIKPPVRIDDESKSLFINGPESLLTGCLLFFLSAMTLVCVSNHFGMLWVAVEATTLASAPMIYFHHRHQSLEAAWKYLLICSIGIALALFGNFLLAFSTTTARSGELPLIFDRLLAQAPHFQPQWLKAAFIFLLVGYGTKMGLAPLHTWLPDAHSESPSFVSALLSGALLNCAFLGILRAVQILAAAGIADFGQELLMIFGLVSMGFAATFIFRQPDYKRMLAYSSVEHMGILALGIGLGGAAVFGSMFHAVNHSLTKAMLFLVSGNILAATHSKSTQEITGLSQRTPLTAALWMAGFFAIAGSPPFGTFLSEFIILRAAIEQGHMIIAVGYLLILSVIFITMASIVLRMCHGQPSGDHESVSVRESWIMILPPAILGVLAMMLGVYMPSFLDHLLRDAVRQIGIAL